MSDFNKDTLVPEKIKLCLRRKCYYSQQFWRQTQKENTSLLLSSHLILLCRRM